MHFLTYVLCFLFLLLPFTYSDSDVIDTFEKFKKKFKKSYKNAAEERIREANFNRAVERVKRMSLEKPKLKFKVNDYSDLSDDEWNAMFPFVDETKSKKKETIEQFKLSQPVKQVTEGPLPVSVNWIEELTPSKWPAEMQNWSVGHCYAFAALGVIEARIAITNLYLDKPPNLSKQEVLECTDETYNYEYDSHGCSGGGGHRRDVYEYAIEHGVIDTMDGEIYPYRGTCGKCDEGIGRYNSNFKRYKIATYKIHDDPEDDKIMELLAWSGPISAGMYFHRDVFAEYAGEVITDTYRKWEGLTNHAVVLVGYGHDDKQNVDYWLIRNSQGPNWGDNGYFKIERGHKVMGINNHVEEVVLNRFE